MSLQRIGNYEVLGELGRGGMGVVYKGVDSFIKRPVAIKTIYLSEIQEDHERQFLKERLYREAQSAGILSHPNIVTIYQIGEQEEITYIVMEFVEGKNLAQVLRSPEKPTVEALLSIFEQTAAALDHAHSMGVIHRDIKPANIIVRSDGVAKITDFGVAKIASQTVTRTGMTLGTPHFMAPEQIQGKTIDGRADQYALGVVIYEIFTGRKPFTADSMTTLIFKIVTDSVDPKRDNPNLGDEAANVLKRALAKEASDRYPNCQAMVQAFRNAIGMPGSGTFGFAGTGSGLTGTGFPSGHTPTGTQPMGQRSVSTQTGLNQPRTLAGHPGVGLQTPTPTPTPAAPPVAKPAAMPRPTPPFQPPVRAGSPASPPQQPPSVSVSSGAIAQYSAPKAAGNRWLIAVLIGVGLALVVGVFGILQLLRPRSESGNGKIASAQGATGSVTAGGGETAGGTVTPPVVSPGSGSGIAKPREASGSATSSSRTSSPGSTASRPTTTTKTPPPVTKTFTPPPSISGGERPGSGSVSSTPVPKQILIQPPTAGTGSSGAGSRPSPPGSIKSAPSGTVGGGSGVKQGSPPSIPVPAVIPATPEQKQQASQQQPVFTAPKPIVRVPAIYPAQARRDGVSGSVLLQAVVNEAGQPTSVNVMRGIRPDLDQAAKEALTKWRFQPGTADGKPVESRVNVEIAFSLVQEQRKPISLKNP